MDKKGQIRVIFWIIAVAVILGVIMGFFIKYYEQSKINCGNGEYDSKQKACIFNQTSSQPVSVIKCPSGFNLNENQKICEKIVESVYVCDNTNGTYNSSTGNCIVFVKNTQYICQNGTYNSSTGICDVIIENFTYSCSEGTIQEINGTNFCVVSLSVIKKQTVIYCGNGECDEKELAQGICPQDCENITINQTNENLSEYEDSPFGIHPALVDGNYNNAKDIGVTWGQLNIGLAWAINQPDINSNAYHFKTVSQKGQLVDSDDLIVSQISNLGHVYGAFEHDIPIIENPNDDRYYSTSSETFPVSWKPKDPLKLSNYIKKAVERYDGDDDYGCIVSAPDCYVVGDNEYPVQETIDTLRNAPIKNWVIGNEPSVAIIKGGNLDNNYDVYAKIAVESIKSVCSDCKVFNGGFTGWPAHYTEYIDGFILILARMGNIHFDAIDFHWYGTAIGDYKFIDPVSNLDVINHLKSKFAELGYPSNVPMWITEMSSYSGMIERGANPDCLVQTEQQQSGDYVKRYIYSGSRGVKKIFTMFGLIEGYGGDDGYYDHTGLIYDGLGSSDLGRGVKKLSYYSYKLMTEKLEGSDWDNVQEVYNSGNVYAYKLINKQTQKLIYVLWWDYWNEPSLTTKQVSIPVSITGNVKITEAVPKYETGQEITNYAAAFNFGGVSVSSGQIIITLGQSPVYIEGTYENLVIYTPHAWQNPITPTSSCGDNICNGSETVKTCPQDCSDSSSCAVGQVFCVIGQTCGGTAGPKMPEGQCCTGTCTGGKSGSCGDGVCDSGEKDTCPNDCIINK